MALKAVPKERPNILVIFGDDIGIPQVSAYTRGLMGYQTPNIDRIANEGALFTDAYGQQSCTAGRASFILGQEPFRTGLLTIGMPGDPHGITDWMPTIADVLKTQGYATGQFGKNHLGDRDEHLPTNHGFDEFFGNLYHLNAEEEPEGYFYPKDPSFKKKYGPRGVIHGRTARVAARSKTPVPSTSRGCQPSMKNSWAPRRASSNEASTPSNRSSAGSTPRACTCSPI
jgi:arylsulfatase A-like enzyme